MPLYEHVFLGRQDISAQQFEALIESYKSIIGDNGGAVDKTEYWGLKNLTFKIKKNRKAHFALMNINAPHDAVAEMERQMGLSTDVIRFLTLRVDELEGGPSPMMKRGDRDDRRGGRRDRDRDSGPRSGDRDRKPAESKPADSKASESKAAESKPADSKAAEAKPDDTRKESADASAEEE